MLLTELREGVAQRGARYPNKATLGSVQLQNEKDRARDRQPADEQGAGHGCVSGRAEAEADENHGKPENQDCEHEFRDRVARLCIHQPAGFAEGHRRARRLGLERALRVVCDHSACIVS